MNKIYFSGLAEHLSLRDSLLDGPEGLLQRGKGVARMYKRCFVVVVV